MSSNNTYLASPLSIFVLSGKRKSGKDYLADILLQRLGSNICQILRLSGPLKKQYAQENGLDYEELLNATDYKEIHRASMIKWGEDKRNREPYYFCWKIVEEADVSNPVWIVSDARRKTDIQFFKEYYPDVVKFVRISASENTRQQRGFVFTTGVDDAESECGLDSGIEWDFIINNDCDDVIHSQVEQLVTHVEKQLRK